MGGKTAAKVKNANTRKNYDRLAVFVPKGKKAFLIQIAKEAGFESLNSYVNYCINQDVAGRKGPQREEEVRKAEFIRVLVPDIEIHKMLCVCEQEALCSELTLRFSNAEVTCCSQQELYLLEKDSFDVVILTKPLMYLDEPEITLTKLKDVLKKGGIFVWCFDEEGIQERSLHVAFGNSEEYTEKYPMDVIEESGKKLEDADAENDYHIVDKDNHGYEPWIYILAWKNATVNEMGYKHIMEQWDEAMSQYYDTYFAASGGNPWK